MATKKAARKPVIFAPKNRAELEQSVAKIREEEARISEIEAKYAKTIKKLINKANIIKKRAQVEARPHESTVNVLAKGVYRYAESHRAELIPDEQKTKTVEFPFGDKIKWYLTPQSVSVEDEKLAIEELKQKKLFDLIRTIEEVNKEKILQTPDAIKGLKSLSISQSEIFAIVPANFPYELQRGERKFKKVKPE